MGKGWWDVLNWVVGMGAQLCTFAKSMDVNPENGGL